MTAPVAYAPPLTIRNLPLDMVEWLKEQASAQHRSLNKHVAALLADWRQSQMTVPSRIQEDEETQRRLAALKVIMARAATLPILDHRTADEILGYDDAGLPS